MADVALVATARPKFGKGAARQLRRAGLVPAVFYGPEREAKAIAVPLTPLSIALMQPLAILDLEVDGRKLKAAARDVQRHPVSHQVEHLDIVELDESQVRERAAAAEAAVQAEAEAARLAAIESRRLAALAAEAEAKETAAAEAAATAAPASSTSADSGSGDSSGSSEGGSG